MAEEDAIPHSWKALVLYALTIVLANRASWIAALFKRKQSQADAEKASEEARTLGMVNDLKSGDALVRLTVRMVAATERAERNRAERDHWERKAGEWESRCRILEKQADEQIAIGRSQPTKRIEKPSESE